MFAYIIIKERLGSRLFFYVKCHLCGRGVVFLLYIFAQVITKTISYD